MRKRFRQRAEDLELEEIPDNWAASRPLQVRINRDYEAFESPIDNSVVSGRRARREHMAQKNVVPYERIKR